MEVHEPEVESETDGEVLDIDWDWHPGVVLILNVVIVVRIGSPPEGPQGGSNRVHCCHC